jgi:hypothetical protein
MPFADPRARLEHILEAVREIDGFAAGKTLQDYLGQGWLRFATQRGIEIVSEASRRIPVNFKSSPSEERRYPSPAFLSCDIPYRSPDGRDVYRPIANIYPVLVVDLPRPGRAFAGVA